mgnify:CR=1 FL=1
MFRMLTLVLLFLPFVTFASDGLIVTVPDQVQGVYRDDLDWPTNEWAFRTEVHNATDRPLRITAFGTLVRGDDGWTPPGDLLSPEDFVAWYTDGDAFDEGWIPPGATVVDARNWSRDPDPLGPAVKWLYRAEDADGNTYETSRYVDYLPVPIEGRGWPERYPEDRVRVTLEVVGADGAPVDEAVVHVGREFGGSGPFVATAIDGRGGVEIVRPALVRCAVRAPGSLPVHVPLQIGDDVGDFTLRVPVVAPDADVLPDPEASDATVQAGIELVSRVRAMQREIREDYEAFKRDNPGATNYDVVHPALHDLLVATTRDASRPAIARLAAYLSYDWSPPFGEDDQAHIASLLPPDAYEWGMAAMYATNASNHAPDRDAFIEGLADNRDPTVRVRALGYLGSVAKSNGDTEKLTEIVSALRSREYVDIPDAAWHREMLLKSDKLAVGEKLPAFDLPTLDGQGRVTDRDPDGRFTFLHFWATWCGPCMAEMEEIHHAFDEAAGDRLRFVSVSMDFKKDAINRLRDAKWPMPWTHVWWKDVPDYEGLFDVNAIPQLFLIDPQGTIVAASDELRGEKLAETLVEMTGADAGSGPD